MTSRLYTIKYRNEACRLPVQDQPTDEAKTWRADKISVAIETISIENIPQPALKEAQDADEGLVKFLQNHDGQIIEEVWTFQPRTGTVCVPEGLREELLIVHHFARWGHASRGKTMKKIASTYFGQNLNQNVTKSLQHLFNLPKEGKIKKGDLLYWVFEYKVDIQHCGVGHNRAGHLHEQHLLYINYDRPLFKVGRSYDLNFTNSRNNRQWKLELTLSMATMSYR